MSRTRLVSQLGLALNEANRLLSRTYGENTGEDIREGFEPAKHATNLGSASEVAVGSSDEESRAGSSEAARQWKQAHTPELMLQPKYGLGDEGFENVWTSDKLSEPPRENP